MSTPIDELPDRVAHRRKVAAKLNADGRELGPHENEVPPAQPYVSPSYFTCGQFPEGGDGLVATNDASLRRGTGN